MKIRIDMIQRLCTYQNCGRKAQDGKLCFYHKPGAPMKRKSMRRVGKIGKRLSEQSKAYIAEHEPPYNCIYCLYIGIDIPLLPEDMCINVEHTKSKTRNPALRFTKDNLAISCSFHNRLKASLNIDNFLKILDKQMQYQKED